MRRLFQAPISRRSVSSSNHMAKRTPLDSPLYMGSSTPFVVSTAARLHELESSPLTHVPPATRSEQVCIRAVRCVRWTADKLFRERYVHRALMLKGLASVPGTVAAVACHVRSLFTNEHPRLMRTALGEAENHRMHFAVLSEVAPPTRVDRCVVAVLQLLCFSLYFLLYVASPPTAHRLTAYFCEEASVVLTQMLNDIDTGKVANTVAPSLAIDYWGIVAHHFPSPAPPHTRVPDAASTVGIAAPRFDGAGATSGETPRRCGVPNCLGDHADNGEGGAFSPLPRPPPATTSGTVVGDTSDYPPFDVPRLREVILLMRADEMVHRDSNHAIASALREQQKRSTPAATKRDR